MAGRGEEDVSTVSSLPGKRTLSEPIGTEPPFFSFYRSRCTFVSRIQTEIDCTVFDQEGDLGLVLE